jgi:hypothetical protein
VPCKESKTPRDQQIKEMKPLAKLSLSIAILGAIWAYLAIGPRSGYVLVWPGFIAWGC